MEINISGINYEELSAEDDESKIISITKNSTNINIYYKNTLSGKNELMTLETKLKKEGNTYNNNINAKYENSKNRIELIIKKESKIVEDFEKTINLDNKNSILINNLNENQLQNVLNKVTDKVGNRINNLLEEAIDVKDLKKMLENIEKFFNS